MKKILLSTLVTMFFVAQGLYAQELALEERLTQEQFAVELVKIMKLEYRLPPAALPRDSVNLLNRFGISPLSGWRNKDFLNQENYLVIIGKAQGKERLVHKRALDIEHKNIDVINQKWQESYEATKTWMPLQALLNDRTYFPNGAPKSPYGTAYADVNGDHKVDPYFSPIASLEKLRESLTLPQ